MNHMELYSGRRPMGERRAGTGKAARHTGFEMCRGFLQYKRHLGRR